MAFLIYQEGYFKLNFICVKNPNLAGRHYYTLLILPAY